MPFIPIGTDWQITADHFIHDYCRLPYQQRVPVILINPDQNHPAINYLQHHGLTVIPFDPFTNAPHEGQGFDTALAR